MLPHLKYLNRALERGQDISSLAGQRRSIDPIGQELCTRHGCDELSVDEAVGEYLEEVVTRDGVSRDRRVRVGGRSHARAHQRRRTGMSEAVRSAAAATAPAGAIVLAHQRRVIDAVEVEKLLELARNLATRVDEDAQLRVDGGRIIQARELSDRTDVREGRLSEGGI